MTLPKDSPPSAAALVRAITVMQDVGMLETLLDRGGDANAMNENKSPLLLLAAINNAPDMVELLLQRGARLDEANALGRTALICAARLERYGVEEQAQRQTILLLLEAGARMDIEDYDGMTALDHAKAIGNDKLAVLIERTAETRRLKAEEEARLKAEAAQRLALQRRQETLRNRAPNLRPKP